MGLGSLLHRASSSINVSVQTTDSMGAVLSSDVYTITDGLIPSWAAAHYHGAMQLPGAWRACLIASDLLGSLPWYAYEIRPDGTEIMAPDQPGLLVRPSPPDQRVTTFSSWMLDYIWHGNAVSVRTDVDDDGDVTGAVPIPIGNVAIGRAGTRDRQQFRDGSTPFPGQVTYRIGRVLYRADEVIHIKGPCEPGALRGMGALESHLSGSISAGLELQRQAANISISGVPTGVLKVTAPDLTATEASTVRARFLASQRERSIAVLNDVTEFESLAWNPTETQLLDARKYSLHEIALIVGVPLYFLGVETSNRTYSNVEQEGIVLTRFHLGGAIVRFEQTLSGCLREGRTVRANLDAVLRADTLTRYQAWEIGANAGFLTVNEIRQREGLPPMPGGDRLIPAPAPGQTVGEQDIDEADPQPPEIGDGDGAGIGQATQGRDDADESADVFTDAHAFEIAYDRASDPGGRNLKAYWTRGPGRARWSTWTELYRHLLKYLPAPLAKRTASQWFHDVKGFWPGDKRNRASSKPVRDTNGHPVGASR
jgi:HK97 family phage portal protein